MASPQSLIDMFHDDGSGGEVPRELIEQGMYPQKTPEGYVGPTAGSMGLQQFFGLPRGEQDLLVQNMSNSGATPNPNEDSLIGRLWRGAPDASRERYFADKDKTVPDIGLANSLLGPTPPAGTADYYQTMTGQPAPPGTQLASPDQFPKQPPVTTTRTGWRFLPSAGWVHTDWPQGDIQAVLHGGPRAQRPSLMQMGQPDKAGASPFSPQPAAPAAAPAATPTAGGWQKPAWWSVPWMGQ